MSIVLEKLTKRFDDVIVVDNFTLEVRDGELFVLLGASGSGKSTVLRLVAGLLAPNAGRVELNGRDVTHLPPQARGVGYVFQNYSIFRHMNVAENVEFGLKIRNVPVHERVRRREELLHLVELAGLGNRYASQLSGGQQQRVALARALAYEPAVLLLDEPFSALDVKIRGQLRRTLRQIQRQLGVATILVTHDQEEAFELADRIGVMERGRLLEIGEAEQLYYQPKTAFVATFVGSGTVLVGRVEDDGAALASTRLPIPENLAYEVGERVQVLIRPEQVSLAAGRPAGAAPVLGQGKVVEQVFAGPTRRVRVQLPHLPGTRQIAPVVPFGEEHTLLEAVVPAGTGVLPDTVWVCLDGWHVLAPQPWQLFVFDDGRGRGTVLTLAGQLGTALKAAVTVLAVTGEGERRGELEQMISRRMSAAGLGDATLKVRVGRPAEEILREEGSALYDLVLLAENEAVGNVSEYADVLLEGSSFPTLIVRGTARVPQKIMICTAAGEPGKQDVHVGGRLARRLGAAVLLLHTLTPTTAAIEELAQRHLERALGTLRGLDVAATSRVRVGENAAQTILEEARTEAVDLIVIGQHAPELRLRVGENNVMRQVVAEADRPVLVVPER